MKPIAVYNEHMLITQKEKRKPSGGIQSASRANYPGGV